jgi:hypothetical protein
MLSMPWQSVRRREVAAPCPVHDTPSAVAFLAFAVTMQAPGIFTRCAGSGACPRVLRSCVVAVAAAVAHVPTAPCRIGCGSAVLLLRGHQRCHCKVLSKNLACGAGLLSLLLHASVSSLRRSGAAVGTGWRRAWGCGGLRAVAARDLLAMIMACIVAALACCSQRLHRC